MAREPETSSPMNSIWVGVDRPNFENHIIQIQNCVPKPKSYENFQEGLQDYASYTIPFTLEQQLADDFAFITRFDPGAKWITAAAVEVGKTESHLRVVLAANEGIQDIVRQSFEDIVQSMKQCARRGKLILWHPTF